MIGIADIVWTAVGLVTCGAVVLSAPILFDAFLALPEEDEDQ